jgi:hypothetical protein
VSNDLDARVERDTGRGAAEPERYAADGQLPPAVRAVVDQGRRVLAERARAAADQARREREQVETAVREWLGPIAARAREMVGPDLAGYLALPVADLADDVQKGWALDRRHEDVIVALRAPGCVEVKMVFQRDETGRFRPPAGYEFQIAPNRGRCGLAWPDLAVTLACARERYLEQLEADKVPL